MKKHISSTIKGSICYNYYYKYNRGGACLSQYYVVKVETLFRDFSLIQIPQYSVLLI